MGGTVQARLDPESEAILRQLAIRLGWSPSRSVREGLRLLAASHARRDSHRVIGTGKFASAIPDLGSNRKHLSGFGRGNS